MPSQARITKRPHRAGAPARLSWQRSALAVLAVATAGAVAYLLATQWSNKGETDNGPLMAAGKPADKARRSDHTLETIPFDGAKAYEYLKQLCDLGPRPSGSEAMRKQQTLLTDHFRALGGKVRLQEFDVRHPITGARTTLANLIVEWHPDRKERILLCAHYDTRPYPDRDPDPAQRKGAFVGANDGASGVALLMEMGRQMSKYDSRYGVDFVLFDAEEFIFDEARDEYFLGSEWFARDYAKNPPKHTYRWGVLLDMVADADLQIYQEGADIQYRKARPLVKEIWDVAKDLKVREFIALRRHQLRDDHLPLNETAKIPTIDLIDFDYPHPGARPSYWHTTRDVPENCSALSLAKVGWVVWEWMKRTK